MMDKTQTPRGPERQRVSIDGVSSFNRPVSRPLVRLERRPALTAGAMARLQPAEPAALPVLEEAPIRRAARIDMGLPGAEVLIAKHPVFRRRVRLARHWLFRTAVAAVILVVASGGLLVLQGMLSAQKVFKGGASRAAALQANVNPNLLKGEGEGRINILLMGNGGAGHDGADLTDTMIVASIDPVNKTASLLSVPRDLWVKNPVGGSTKINAAYALAKYKALGRFDSSNADTDAVMAGFKAADQTIETVLGIDIHYNLVLNFTAFRQAVDTVGGVTVNVPKDLYDPTMAWENDWNPTLAKAGIQNFDGKHALIYVRSRETSSDFARGERQRAVMLALKDKVATLGTLSNPVKLSQLLGNFGNNVVTDMSLKDASRLYTLGKGITSTKVRSIGLADEPNKFVTTGRVGNQSVVLPTAGMYDYGAIQTYVRSQLPDGYILKEHAQVAVLNGTTVSGLAEDKANDLQNYGYSVGTVGDAPTKDYQRTTLIDLSHGKDKYTRHYLEQHFNVKAVSNLPAGSTIQKGQADFILILGNDETSS